MLYQGIVATYLLVLDFMQGFIQKIRETTRHKKSQFSDKKTPFFHFGLSLKRRHHFQLSLRFKRVALENGPTFY